MRGHIMNSVSCNNANLPKDNKNKKILLTSISSDSHTWNLVFMQLLLEFYGYEVMNLGACVPDELVLSTLKSGDYDAVVVSTVNGHGHIDGMRLIDKIRSDKSLKDIPVIIGGKLGVSGKNNYLYVDELHNHGFNAVYVDDVNAHEFLAYLGSIKSPRTIKYGA